MFGNIYITPRPVVDNQVLRHEAKHANQWLIPGFPLLYAVFPKTFEAQAGLNDGCYTPASRARKACQG